MRTKRYLSTQEERKEFGEWLQSNPDIDLSMTLLDNYLIRHKNEDKESIFEVRDRVNQERLCKKPAPTKFVRREHRKWVALEDGEVVYDATTLKECKKRFSVENISRVDTGVYTIERQNKKLG